MRLLLLLHVCPALAVFMAAGSAPAQTSVTLLLDDSRNPEPFATIYFATNVEPSSGQYAADWTNFVRRPMYDDGAHGDGAAGDHLWGIQIKVLPRPGQLFEWAADDDANADNGWLGPCPPFMIEDASAKKVKGDSMPEEAYKPAAQMSREYGIDLSRAAAPHRLAGTDRVLFTFQSTQAERVYLAGSFNDWARNLDGVIGDPRTTMYPAGNGVWYRLLQLHSHDVQYKYVVYTGASDYQWVGDPTVPAKDADGNTILNVSALPETSAEQASATSSGGVTWKPFAHSTLRRLLQDDGRALVYIRMKDNPRCKSFEEGLLLSDNTKSALAGKTVLYIDAGDPALSPELRSMRVFRVPALAWSKGDGSWNLYIYEDSPADDLLMDYLNGFNTSIVN